MAQRAGYSWLQIGLHWGIVLLIAVNYVVSDEMGSTFRAHMKGSAVDFFPAMFHAYVGLAVLFLALLRLLVRLVRGVPQPPEEGGALMHQAAHWGHIALYVLMIAMPALGAVAWYLNQRWAGDVHEISMNALLILAGGHALAGLFHHYVLKDRLLDRMRRPG